MIWHIITVALLLFIVVRQHQYAQALAKGIRNNDSLLLKRMEHNDTALLRRVDGLYERNNA